ncbi:MAG: glycine cleavage system protein GcvH [Rhizobiaceae bacterium]|nr:glycine cleavage system protein GcvH [Rhizobiaceae bacterium]
MSVYFTDDHEWVSLEGDIATLGVTKHAAEQLGDVVFVELQDAGDTFDKGDTIGVVESVKAASDIYAPISGEITEANSRLDGEPALINLSAEGDAWLYKIKISDKSEFDDLLDADAYQALIA